MERRGDLLGKLLAKLNAPLIVGVDFPYCALDVRDVLVHGDELSEGERGLRVAENGGRGAVALEHASGDDMLGRTLGANLIGRLAECKGSSWNAGVICLASCLPSSTPH